MKAFLLIIVSLFLCSCATQKQAKNCSVGFNEIQFGSGGGFTGASNEFILRQDGSVYKNIGDSLNKLNTIEISEIEQIDKSIASLDFEHLELNETGNMTYFIEIKSQTYSNKVTWTNQTECDSLKQLYKTLIKTLKK